MNRRAFWALLVAVGSATALGYATWRFIRAREELSCKACSRPVDSHTRTVAVVDSERGVYCCPACALSEHRQARTPVEVTELADYLGGPAVVPARAFLVRESDVNPCKRRATAVSVDKQPLHAHFDRCAPSILAFPSRALASGFAAEHGGQVLAFPELAAQFSR